MCILLITFFFPELRNVYMVEAGEAFRMPRAGSNKGSSPWGGWLMIKSQRSEG